MMRTCRRRIRRGCEPPTRARVPVPTQRRHSRESGNRFSPPETESRFRGNDGRKVVRAIVMASIPVAGVEPERNELERIFLEVTKGEVQ